MAQPSEPKQRWPTLAEVNRVNAAEYREEATFCSDRFSYLIQERDQLQDKLRFGALTLNGASLIALMSFLGNGSPVAKSLGFTAENAKYSAIAFTIGVILAAISAVPQSNLLTREAGDANTRRLKARWLWSFHTAEATPENWDKLMARSEEFADAPLVDSQYSSVAITLQNLAGGAWLAGVLVPLGAALF